MDIDPLFKIMHLQDTEKENREIVKRYKELLTVWSTNKTPEDIQRVKKAFSLALEAHKDMRRKSGEPYIYHPMEVAQIVAGEIGLGTTSIICALLHDVVEDTDYTLNDIKNQFGDKVARIIDGLTKIEEIFDHTNSSLQAENFKKILLTLSDDVRVILIKLADRLHNMRTLESMPREKQLRISSETIYLYAPLALRLGLYSIKNELEDLTLKYTEPDIYYTINEKLQQTQKERGNFVKSFLKPIEKDFEAQGISFVVETEIKSVYSIWEKMKSREIPFEEVHDSFAIRFIIEATPATEKVDCWRVYTILTDHYRPNVERLRDWISIPRANGYESLHATLMSKKGKWVEIQIRSQRMHEIAEKGYVALWKYKTSGKGESALEEWFSKIREMLQTDESNALDFLSDFKMNLFSDEIYVFTPKGEMIGMPNGSTILDFAYNIHTQIGNECIGAKVNHKLVPVNHHLKSGDQVEIITSKRQIPKEEWFSYVTTARAKHRIKNAIREYRKTYRDEGKDKLKKLFDQINLEFAGAKVQMLQQRVNIPSSIDLYYQVSQGTFGLKELKAAFPEGERGLFRYLSRTLFKGQKTLSDSIREKVMEKPESLVIGGEISAITYEISPCCNPIPGDDVIGFIHQNKPIEIHHTNCNKAINLMSTHANRIVKTKWRKKELISFLAGIKITAIDNIGFINELTNIISQKQKLNIRSFHLESSDGVTQCIVLIYLPDVGILNELINNLKKIKEIKKITRIKRLSDSSL